MSSLQNPTGSAYEYMSNESFVSLDVCSTLWIFLTLLGYSFSVSVGMPRLRSSSTNTPSSSTMICPTSKLNQTNSPRRRGE